MLYRLTRGARRLVVVAAVAAALVAGGGVSATAADNGRSKKPVAAGDRTPLVPKSDTAADPGTEAEVGIAHAGCYDTGCKGRNPSTSGCGGDARTLEEFTDGSFRVELRYSPACYAAWTRITTRSGTPGSFCNATFGQIRGYDIAYDTRKGVYGTQAACPGQSFTAMWPFSDGVRACVSYYWYDGEPKYCTARR